MLRLFILSWIVFYSLTNIYAQKHDNNWYFGYVEIGDKIAQSTINFNNDSLFLNEQFGKIKPDNSNVTYSDSSGNLLLIANGCMIADANQDTIQNGAGLNPGYNASSFCPDGTYNIYQWGFFLPYPGDEKSKTVLIHVQSDIVRKALMYTVVDLEANNGNPAITAEKNVVFVNDTIGAGCTAAVKHANGRDWWIVAKKRNSNKYYIHLLDPTGMHFSHTQTIGVGPIGDFFMKWFLPPMVVNWVYLMPEKI
jgi:hypothetical protein